MAELTLSPLADSRRSRGRGLGVIVAGLVLAGLATCAWFGWQTGWLQSQFSPARQMPVPPPAANASASGAAIVTQGNLIATNAALADATARLTALQQRLAELSQQTAAASGQATRAEALLVAVATRRAVERGQPLGYLETALRVRFGNSQQGAVDEVVAAALKPVTIGGLTEEFALIEARLASGPANEGTMDWLARQVGGMFVIRHDDTPSPAPESRIARARAALAGQRVDLAIAEVERLPGKDAATDWLAHAREWVATQHALDQLESAALATPTPSVASSVAPTGVVPVVPNRQGAAR